MTYRSKVDLWLAVLVAGGPISVIGVGIYLFYVGGPEERLAAYIMLGSGIGFALLLALVAFPLQYEIGSTELRVRSGFLRNAVPLASIVAARPTRNPLSAPAFSLDRLRVDYRRGERIRFLLLSPADKIGFVRELGTRVPGAIVDGAHLRLADERRRESS